MLRNSMEVALADARYPEPVVRLWRAVIVRAVQDVTRSNIPTYHKTTAETFLASERFDDLCMMVGWPADEIRRQVARLEQAA